MSFADFLFLSFSFYIGVWISSLFY